MNKFLIEGWLLVVILFVKLNFFLYSLGLPEEITALHTNLVPITILEELIWMITITMTIQMTNAMKKVNILENENWKIVMCHSNNFSYISNNPLNSARIWFIHLNILIESVLYLQITVLTDKGKLAEKSKGYLFVIYE